MMHAGLLRIHCSRDMQRILGIYKAGVVEGRLVLHCTILHKTIIIGIKLSRVTQDKCKDTQGLHKDMDEAINFIQFVSSANKL